jgi:predicted Zn-dependent protease with MMP-like domain
VRFATHASDRLVQFHAAHGRAVDALDQVAGLDAGAGGRRILDRRHDLDGAVVVRGNLDAEADELAFGAFAQFAESLAVEIGGMGVERADHAGDRLGEELAALHRLDVVGLDEAVGIGEPAQAVHGHAVGDRFLRQRRQLHRDRDAEDYARGDEADVLQS